MTNGRKLSTLLTMIAFMGMTSGEHLMVHAADFTFKRIKVNKNHKGPRINIQIDDARLTTKAAPSSPTEGQNAEAAPSKDMQDWFWEGVSPKIDAADFKRMNSALAQLQRHKSQHASLSPSKARLEKVIDSYGKDMLVASLGKNISPALLLAVISVESGGQVDAVSSAGAKGLMQLIPATAERFNVKDRSNSLENIKGGAAYLDWLLSEFRYDPLLALAGYNAGEGAVKKHDGIPPYAETRKYVPKVVAAWDVARTLCKTPPLLVTDPCVFKSQ